MKAFYQTSYNRSDADNYSDLPDPVAGNDQVLIEVKAVSINPVDYKIRNGDLKLIVGSKFPKIVGSDYAGIVKSVGSDIEDFKPGDRVYGAVPAFSGKQGSLAGLLGTDSKNVRHIPEGMSFDEAASLPVAALTALNGLRRSSVTSGSMVLINGGSGGVGHFGVQIAKAKGAFVTVTCSEANRELVKQLGADEISGYEREVLASTSKKFDAILDAYGKMKFKDVTRLLKRGGTYASTLFMPTSFISSLWIKIFHGKKLTSSNMRGLPEDYEEIERLFAEKKLKPVIEHTFTIDRSADAFELAEHGKPRGKIIIESDNTVSGSALRFEMGR